MTSPVPLVLRPEVPATADLCDHYIDKLQVLDPALNLRDYGGNVKFAGRISTVKCRENNPLIRAILGEPGRGRVLVVDGEGALGKAVLGDNIAALAIQNQWEGVILNAAIRDSAQVGLMPLGVKALGTNPIKSNKDNPGSSEVEVTFGGVTFRPGAYVYADVDGVVVSEVELSLPPV